jgi:sec-independent protein translocase protein TatC
VTARDVPSDKKMGFLDHLGELRTRLIRSLQVYVIAMCLCWWQSPRLYGLLARPLVHAWKAAGLTDAPVLAASITEPFEVFMKVALFGGLFLAAPFIFYQLWRFIAPGLYRKEQRWTIIIVVSATLLFAGGVLYGYFIALPMMFRYLFTLHGPIPYTDMRLQPLQRAGDYFELALKMLAVFGLAFELPLVILFLGLIGIVDARMLWKFARYFILIAFVIGAILSPPDVVSQTMVSVPLCLLYVPSILLVAVFGRKKSKAVTPKRP